MSRRELAELASALLPNPIDEKYIGKLERGVCRWPSKAHRRAIRQALDARNDHDLGFFVSRPLRSDGPGQPEVGERAPIPGAGSLVELARFAPSAWGVGAENAPPPAVAYGTRREVLDADDLRGRLDQCKIMDGSAGPGAALPDVLALLTATAECAKRVRDDRRARLLSVAAEGAEFAGWLCRDLGELASAVYWYDRAMDWAQEAQNLTLQGYVLVKKSQMAFDARDAGRVRALADAALFGPWNIPDWLRAEAILQRALGLAMTGEGAGEVEREVARAEALLARADPASECGPGGPWERTLRLRAAACLTEAGRPRRAADLFDEVISAGGLSRRDEGFFQARRSTALALAGEPDEAASMALHAVMVGRATSSSRTLKVVSETAAVLDRWRDRSGPRALRDALAATG